MIVKQTFVVFEAPAEDHCPKHVVIQKRDQSSALGVKAIPRAGEVVISTDNHHGFCTSYFDIALTRDEAHALAAALVQVATVLEAVQP